MEGFLKIIRKKNIEVNIQPLLDLLRDYKRNQHFVYTKRNEKIISIYFTNEFNEYPYEIGEEELFTPVGNFINHKNQVKKYLSNEDWNSISQLQGSFAIGHTDFERGKVILITHVARVENIFLYEDENLIIAGTDPLLVSLQSSFNFKPQFEPENYYSFIQNGYYTDNLTPYKGVESIPPNEIVEIQNGKVTSKEVDDSLENFLNCNKEEFDFDHLTQVFLDGFKTNMTSADRLALTGGKDSRLIFAAMKELGYDFTVFTNGFEENPDIIISKMIAQKYNIEHDIITPQISESNTLTVNPFNRMLNTMIGSSGLIYGYDSVNVSPKGFQGDRTFDGVAAGLAKGGYSAFNNLKNKNKIINNFTKSDSFFINSKREKYTLDFEDSFRDNLTPNQYNMLSFLNYRTGRWTANSKLGKNYTKRQHSPFTDNLFIKLFLKLNYKDNNNEIILYEIMKRLDEHLVNIPFAKDRWKFEKEHPLNVSDYTSWLQRKELYPKTLLGNYNWRNVHNNDEVLVKHFREIILSNKSSNVFDVVNYKSIEKLFDNDIKQQENKVLWSLASKIIFISHFENTATKFKKKQIELKIPSTTVTNIQNQPELIDYTHSMFPINNSLSIDSSNEIIIVNLEKNRYLNSHKGKFHEVPDSKLVNNKQKISMAAHIEADENSKIEVILVLYDESARIKNLRFKPLFDKEEKSFIWTESVNLPATVKRVRPLILFKDREEGKKYKLNYINLKI